MAAAVDPSAALYAEQGYLSPIRVMSEDAAIGLHAGLEQACATQPDRAEAALGTNCHLRFPDLYDLALAPAILDAVQLILGPDILVWTASMFAKPASSGKFVSWHQDSTYWGLEPPDIVTAWVALTHSTVESGCMRVVPGSHRWGQLAHADSFGEANMLSRGQEVQVDVDESQASDIVLRPGEMSLHHVRIVHGSKPNRAGHPRIGFAIRYIPTRCRQHGGRTFAVLARGVDRYRHFDAPPRPGVPLGEAAWAAREEAVRRLNAVLMQGAAQETMVAGHRPLG